MKIVVSYYSGSEWSGSDYIHCIEYDSCEAFYCHLEEKIKEFLAKCKAKDNARNHFDSRRSQFKPEDILKELQKINAMSYQEDGKTPIDTVKLSGSNVLWYLPNFIGENNTIDMPTIQTLEEWFESNKE